MSQTFPYKPALLPRLCLIALTPIAPCALADQPVLNEVTVTAEFRDTAVLDTAGSLSVFDGAAIERREAVHLEQLLSLAPNVNYSSGASRGRFIQIRGIGERSQFIEPINPSVGILIDGIDFTGIGTAATTLDIQQVEILRGPQGTLAGANALAGLINMVSNGPSEALEGRLSAATAEYDTRTLSAAAGGPLSDALGYRLALQRHASDGYIENDFLHRDDTNNLDELTLRSRLRWQASSNLVVDVTGFYADIDNGYDAFSLDNTRHTFSDTPGHDRQETVAGAIKTTWQASEAFNVEALVSHADSNLEYSYDEDWSYPGLCAGTVCDEDLWGFSWEYASFDNYLRDNRNTAIDLRLVSNNHPQAIGWVAGLYHRRQSESLLREYTFAASDFTSDFRTRNTAVYGQLDIPLGDRFKLIAGGRIERRSADYSDSDGIAFDPNEDLWGGKLALEYRLREDSLLYGLVSRGYKAGGFNSNASLPAGLREFDTETLWNYEAGIKSRWLDDRLQLQAALFYQDRRDLQAKQSLVQPIAGSTCPCSFTDYTDNAAAGNNYGLELALNWLARDNLGLFLNLGLLRTAFEDFLSFSHAAANAATGTPAALDGREQAHAPAYQYALGADIGFTEHWYLQLSMEGKDEFYFSDRHDEQSDHYELYNARFGYRAAGWDIALWGRNLTNRDYQVRGFGSFGNDPRRFYVTEPYYQQGEPRIVGLTASYIF